MIRRRIPLALALGLAALGACARVAWGAFTAREATPQTISSGSFVASAPPPVSLAVQARLPQRGLDQIGLAWRLHNRGPTPMPLAGVRIRYYFEFPTQPPELSQPVTVVPHCDYINEGGGGNHCPEVTMSVHAIAAAVAGANARYFFELAFRSGAIAGNDGELDQMSVRLQSTPYGTFPMTPRPWSDRGLSSTSEYADAPCIVVYDSEEERVWGHAPINPPPGECPA